MGQATPHRQDQTLVHLHRKRLGGGTTVYLAGIGAPVNAQGNSLAGNFTAQTHQVFERLRETVEVQAIAVLDE